MSEGSTTDFIKTATPLLFQSLSKNSSDLKYCIFGVKGTLIIKTKSESWGNGRYEKGSIFTLSGKSLKLKPWVFIFLWSVCVA